MKGIFQINLSILFCLLSIPIIKAQEPNNDKNLKPSIEERLIRLEEGQKTINKRIDDLTVHLNDRFDDIKSKIGWLYILLSSIIALNGMMVGSVIWLARQDRPIGQRHYDQLLDNDQRFENEISRLTKDLNLIKAQLELTG